MFSSDVLNEGATIDPQAKFGCKESFIKSTIVKEGVLLDLVKSTYDDRKSNSGNTSNNHRSATNGEVASVNNQLISLVPTRRPEPGGYFWVQHKGKAGKDKDDNTQPMVYPAEGTIMGYGGRYPLDIDGRAVKAQIWYLTHPPAPLLTDIVYESLRGRMKEPTAKKKGNVGEYL